TAQTTGVPCFPLIWKFTVTLWASTTSKPRSSALTESIDCEIVIQPKAMITTSAMTPPTLHGVRLLRVRPYRSSSSSAVVTGWGFRSLGWYLQVMRPAQERLTHARAVRNRDADSDAVDDRRPQFGHTGAAGLRRDRDRRDRRRAAHLGYEPAYSTRALSRRGARRARR